LGYTVIGGTFLAAIFSIPVISGANKKAEKAKEVEQKALANAEYLKAVEQLEKDINQIFDESPSPSIKPSQATPQNEKMPVGEGETEQFLEFMRSFFKDLNTIQNDYLAVLDQSGLNTLFDADRVAADPGFVESRQILTDCRESVYLYRNKTISLFANFPKTLDNFKLRPQTKESFLEGYREGIEKSGPLIRESWDLEARCADIMEQMIDHLENTRSRWTASKGQFLFELDADLEKFNDLLDQLNATVERQEEIKRLSQADTRENFENMKNQLNP
jgi:hypothetical protein